MHKKTALIICGALAREVIAIKKKHAWDVDIFGIPALLHNRPDRIPAAVQNRIATLRAQYDRLIVVYGDCGTDWSHAYTAGRHNPDFVGRAADGALFSLGPFCLSLWSQSRGLR